jgi:hypothetical protein
VETHGELGRRSDQMIRSAPGAVDEYDELRYRQRAWAADFGPPLQLHRSEPKRSEARA